MAKKSGVSTRYLCSYWQLPITQQNVITQLRNNVDALHSNIALSLIKIYSNSYNDIILESLDLCDNLRVQILFY